MPRPAGAFDWGRSCSDTSVGRNPASVLPAPVGAMRSVERPALAFSSSSIWCGRGSQPRAANHSANGEGRSVSGSLRRARAIIA